MGISKTTLNGLLIPLILFALATEVPKARAEATPEASTAPATPAAGANSDTSSKQSAGTKKLADRLGNFYGRMANIGMIPALDQTSQGLSHYAEEIIKESLERYGNFRVKMVEDTASNLSLEEFKRIISKHKIDILIICVIKPTDLDIFVYDRRNFYNIYTYSQVFPQSIQYKLTRPIVEEFTRAVFRRALFNYISDQSFELPREPANVAYDAEIPRWIASYQLVHEVNRELESNWYGSANIGAAYGGETGGNINELLSLEAGFQPFTHVGFQLNADMFSFNVVSLSMNYSSDLRDKYFRYTLGAGPGIGFNSHAIADDPKLPLQISRQFIVLNGAVMFPIVDYFIKLESKIFLEPKGAYISLTPGFVFVF